MSRPRVLCVAPPFAGHLHPLLGLARRLRHAFDLRFVTAPAKLDIVRACGFEVNAVCRDDPFALERIANTDAPVRGNPWRLGRQLRRNLQLLPVLARELDEIVERWTPDAVLADFTAPIAGPICRRRRIPWITTMPSPLVLETRRGTPGYCGGWGPPRHALHRLRDAAGRRLTRAVKRTFGVVFRRQLRRLGTTVYRADGSEAAYSHQSILGLGMWELEFERDWPECFEMIGPVTESPVEGVPAPDLPDVPKARRVLVSVGTHLPWARRTLLDRVESIARACPDLHFVVTLGDADLGSATRRAGSTGRVLVTPYVDYDAHLEHFGAVIHHAGTGIAYSCIRAGLPALVCPGDFDQFDVAARIVHAGIGLRAGTLGGRRSARALRRVLALDPAPRERLRQKLAEYDPFSACERAIRRLLGAEDSTDRERTRAGPAAP